MGSISVASLRTLWRKLEASAKVRSHAYVIVLVFLATLSAFGYYANTVRENVHHDTVNAFQQQLRVLSSATQTRLQLYESFLRGGTGLTNVDQTIHQDTWTAYFKSYNFTDQYPEIEGISFERYVTADQLDAFVQDMRANNQADFTIAPAGDRPVYVPNTYVARYPGPTASPQSAGFDGYTDPARRAAMDTAASTGAPTMSGETELRMAPHTKTFIIYLPVYRTSDGNPPSTIAERKATIYGFVSIGVNVDKFVTDLMRQNSNPNFGLTWQDAQTPGDDPIVFESNNYASLKSQPGHTAQVIPFTLYQHNWKITAVAGPNVVPAADRDRPLTTMFWGLLASIILAGVVWLLISSREFLLNRQNQLEVQSAKDDLLSLASHQLRTPATVVKQYVGMLLQGYSGELTSKQTGMLKHAYDSNERQLQIINQLLYVARLDAGRITLHKELIDISEILDQVYHEQLVEAKLRHQKLIYKPPHEAINADVDVQYFHMVIDNLISNAVKYTPEKGTITLSASNVGDEVQVSVKDTGIGIDEERQQMIFDKFTRLENELAADVSGSGIGLYLTEQIVNLHGGYIEVKSHPGDGSKFTVHQPVNGKERNEGETS
ncbi:MAG: CHASE domain-containing protein [Candidatus Saccharimonadales bacterium]